MTLAIYSSIKRLRSPSSPSSCKSRFDSPGSTLSSPASPSSSRVPFLPASPPSEQIRTSPTKIGYIEMDDDEQDSISKSNHSSLEGFCLVDNPDWMDQRMLETSSSSSSSKTDAQSKGHSVTDASKDQSQFSNPSSSPSGGPPALSTSSSSRRRPSTLSRPQRPVSRSRSRSRSRSASRTRSRNCQSVVPSLSPSPSSQIHPSTSSRCQSLPSTFQSGSARPTSPRSTSFGSAIRTCLDSKGHKVFARRTSDPEAPSPQFTRHRAGIFGIGEDSAEEEEHVDKDRVGRCATRPIDSARTSTVRTSRSCDPPPRGFAGSRPSLPPLLIPASVPRSEAPESSFLRSPSTSPVLRRRTPQPINTFTPPPPLIPPSPSTFASFSQSSSKDLNRRRSGILRRAASSKVTNRASRSTSVYVPKMQASPPRDDVSPQRQLEPESPSPPESIYPITPPLSPTLSSDTNSTGYSTEPLLSPTNSAFLPDPVPAFDYHTARVSPRRSVTVSFNLPLSPLEKARGEDVGLGLTNLESRSPAPSKAPRPSAPPVSLHRYRNFHHRSYSEGYPSPNRFDLFEKDKSIPEHPRIDQVQKLNLVLANPDPPRRPPKSPMRKIPLSSDPILSPM